MKRTSNACSIPYVDNGRILKIIKRQAPSQTNSVLASREIFNPIRAVDDYLSLC